MRGFLSISRVFIDRLICFFLRFPWIFGVPKSGQSGVYLLDVDRKCSDKRTGVLPLHLFHRRREDSRRRRGENSTWQKLRVSRNFGPWWTRGLIIREVPIHLDNRWNSIRYCRLDLIPNDTLVVPRVEDGTDRVNEGSCLDSSSVTREWSVLWVWKRTGSGNDGTWGWLTPVVGTLPGPWTLGDWGPRTSSVRNEMTKVDYCELKDRSGRDHGRDEVRRSQGGSC